MVDDAGVPGHPDPHDGSDGMPVDISPTQTAPAGVGPVSLSVTEVGADIATRAERELIELDELPLAEHPDAYARIHAALDRELAEIDGA